MVDSASAHLSRERVGEDDPTVVAITLTAAEYDALAYAADFLRARAEGLEVDDLTSLGRILHEIAARLDDVHHRWHLVRVTAARLEAAHNDCGYCAAGSGATSTGS
jgi:hypothetical protein